MNHRSTLRATTLVALAATVSLALLGCASTGSASEPTAAAPAYTEKDIQAALQKESTLTVWTWSPNVEPIAEAFEKKYPKVTVKVENVGSGGDHYTKVQNAIDAGKGAPDIATFEYNVLPQFVLSNSLVDLKEFGFQEKENLYDPSVWSTVNINDGLYELPRGFGPSALFYNDSVFKKYDIDVPTTWDEYLDAARKIHAADPNAYIASDLGDGNLTNSLIWAFGGKPYSVDGETVGVNFSDEGTKEYTKYWTTLIDEGLLAPIPMWSNEWYQGLADGSIATVSSGAWMAATLQNGVASGAGQWRVAPLPSLDASKPTSSLNGGGGDAILQQSENKLVAAGFLEFMNAGDGIDISIAQGFYPSTVKELNDPAFLSTKKDFFGGQEINKVFLASAATVNKGWQFLPYNAYASSVFLDTVGGAYQGSFTLKEGLDAWKDELLSYGKKQGFTIK